MKGFLLTCLLGSVSSLVLAEMLKHECPEPMDIVPCYCEEEDGDPEVFCNHLSTPEELYKGVKGLRGHKIYKLSFFMNWILDPVKSDAFDDIPVERISFENSTIKLSSPQFKGMNYLNSIQLRAVFNKTNPLVSLDIGHLKQLREVYYEKNKILSLPNDWIKTAPESLRSVHLEDNSIVTLEEEVFAKIKKLTFLVLESNRILTVTRSMFPTPATDLRSINLSNNKIRYLPNDAFSEMPNLRNLEITGNRLTTLGEPIWGNLIERLTKLDLTGNPLECNASLKWLYTDVKKPVLFFGYCEAPEHLKGKSLSSLKASDL